MANRNTPAIVNDAALATDDMFSDARVEMIRNQIARDAPDHIFAAMLDLAKRRRLDPLAKQISLIKFKGNYTIITTIDGYRALAEQTGLYAGSDAAVFTYAGEKTKAGKNAPETATVTVYKLINGNPYPFSATVYFEEYSTGMNNWDSMPRTMLAKVAESHALRKAFPAVMSGMYEESEMDQAIEGTARVVDQAPRQVDRQTGEITATVEDPQENPWDKASRRFRAVLGSFNATEEEKVAFVKFGGFPSGSTKDMPAEKLISGASFLESQQNPRKFLEDLVASQKQQESQQSEMDMINATVGAEFDAQQGAK